MKRKVVLFAAIVAILGFGSAAHAETVCDEQLVVFGDSLSDTGNVLIASDRAFPPSPPYSGGRFTDGIGISAGLVWVESLADRLGLARPAARLSNVYPATNYAFGGAVTGDSPADFYPVLNPIPETSWQGGAPLGAQIDAFLRDLEAHLGAPTGACGPDPANSLFIMWIGSNDILLLNEDKPGDSVKNIESAIQTLISLGATRFLVANMPDVTVTPGYLAYDSFFVAESVRAEARAEIQKRVIKFNDKLDEALDKIEKKNPGVEIFRFDTFSLLNDIVAHPDDYGVNPNTDIPLLDEQALFIFLEEDLERLLLQPIEYPLPLFWDGVHPASHVHDIFADVACRALGRCD